MITQRLTFKKWLFQHLNEDTPLGDLARDAKDDSGWTGTGTTSLYWRMTEGGACFAAMQTFKEAKRQYNAIRKLQSKKESKP